jgi:hypothetical protein
MKVIEEYKDGKRDFRGANLRGVDLRRANLRGADLRGANLSGADLGEADLRWADLRSADLGGANLRKANPKEANLRWANLRGADLGEADLRWANLSEANLSEANLSGAKYSVQAVLRSFWGDLSDTLCLELMRHDAENHPQGVEAITEWAAGRNNTCLFTRFQTAFHFYPRRKIWEPGPPQLRGWELLVALAAEKGITL